MLTSEERPSRAAGIALLVVYAALSGYVAWHHEPWRDEADSWLAVRDMSLLEIVTWTRNLGSPALWYVLLKPLVWLGLPFPSQQVLHLAIAWAAAGVLLLGSPFPLITRALILSTYFFLYEYAVIARSYALTVLLCFVVAAWYATRDSRPLRFAVAVALLFNTNVHGAIIAATVFLLYLWPAKNRKWSRAAVLTMMAGGVAAYLQVRTAPDAAFPGIVRYIRPTVVWEALGTAFFPGIPLSIAGPASAVLLILITVALRRRKDVLLFVATTLALLGILFVFVWFGGYRHAGLILLVTIVAIWMARQVPRDAVSISAALLFHAGLLVSAAFALKMAHADVKMAFSGGREMGEFIRDHQLDRYEIAAHNLYTESVLPWIPGKRLWYAGVGRYGSYMLFNHEEHVTLRMPYPAAVAQAVVHFVPKGQRWLLLLNAPLPPSLPGFRLVYATRSFVYRHRDERYWLYEWVGSDRR